MRKIVFVLVCSFIALGCMGCEMNVQPEPPFFIGFNTVEIDSAASCCGIDSFVIKSKWMQERINTFLADSARRKEELYTLLQFWYFTDSAGDGYFIENKHLLWDCEGRMLVDLELNGSIADSIHYYYNFPLREIVYIRLGLLPQFPDVILPPDSIIEEQNH